MSNRIVCDDSSIVSVNTSFSFAEYGENRVVDTTMSKRVTIYLISGPDERLISVAAQASEHRSIATTTKTTTTVTHGFASAGEGACSYQSSDGKLTGYTTTSYQRNSNGMYDEIVVDVDITREYGHWIRDSITEVGGQ